MKKLIIMLVVLGVVSGGIYYTVANFGNSNVSYLATSDSKATTTPKSRTDVVKDLIDDLQAKREQDPTFKAKTKEMEEELEKEIANMRKALVDHRKAQSRLDALTIIQTQYDMEISELELVANK